MSARCASIVILAAVLTAVAPASASAHAMLEETVPARGAMLVHPPSRVTLHFGEAVEARFGAVRVYDARGRQVERGRPVHPGARGSDVAVALPRGLPAGSYTVTYRVISADSHPVEGGFTFSIGHGSPTAASVSSLLAGQSSGWVTATAFSIVRAVQFAAIAVGLGALIFLVVCWLPGLRVASGAGRSWRAASEVFAGRLRRIVVAAAVAGVVSALAGVVLEGAVGDGSSFWSAARPSVVGDVLGIRFGVVWGLGALAWAATATLSLIELRAFPALRPASVGATGQALPTGGAQLAGLAVPLVALALLPALGGHGGVEQPVALMLAANVVHVFAAGAWLGGIVVLVVALRAALAQLESADRTRLLVATVGRFSQLAGIAVAALLATGIVQGLVEVHTLAHLFDTAFGRAVLIKLILFCGVIALGAVNRRRLVPGLRRAAAGDEPPGSAGAWLARTLRSELALGLAAVAATGALAGYAPSVDAASGPYSAGATLGPAELEAVVDPATAGPNTIRLDLSDRASGHPYRAVKELTVTAAMPEDGMAAIPLRVHDAGGGRFRLDAVPLAPAGDWMLTVTARVSDFDEYTTHLKVIIR